jgi:glycosyltransferase involved in cell wall biosynthesis
MKVLFINSMRAFGGGEQWLLEAAAGLAARGHEVSIAARRGSALSVLGRGDGHRVFEFPMRGDVDLQSIIGITALMKRGGFDIVSVNVQRAVRLGAIAAYFAGIGAVVERRGLLFRLKNTARNRFIYKRLISRVVVNCEAIRDDLASSGVMSPRQMIIIPNGIDPSRVTSVGGNKLRSELGIGEETRIVAIVGRLVSDKGHGVAFDAFSRILAEDPDCCLLVVGTGGLRDELERQARSLGAAVRFLGHRDDIPAVLDAAEVTMVTSFREGMPHVILESMVAGTPVVATRAAGIPELIENERDGLIVPMHDPRGTAQAALRILRDRELAHRLAANAGRRVRAEFSLDLMIDRVEACFKEEVAAAERAEP